MGDNCVIIGIVAHANWSIQHLDFWTTFLHDFLNEEVYLHQPKDSSAWQKILCRDHLQKALYGLQKNLRASYSRIDATLLQKGLTRARSIQTCITNNTTHISFHTNIICGWFVCDRALMIFRSPHLYLDSSNNSQWFDEKISWCLVLIFQMAFYFIKKITPYPFYETSTLGTVYLKFHWMKVYKFLDGLLLRMPLPINASLGKWHFLLVVT